MLHDVCIDKEQFLFETLTSQQYKFAWLSLVDCNVSSVIVKSLLKILIGFCQYIFQFNLNHSIKTIIMTMISDDGQWQCQFLTLKLITIFSVLLVLNGPDSLVDNLNFPPRFYLLLKIGSTIARLNFVRFPNFWNSILLLLE